MKISSFEKGRRLASLALFAVVCWSMADAAVDRIVAVVDDGVILESELVRKVEEIKRSLRASRTSLPPDAILVRQVLERMIVDKIQIQMAEKMGIQVDDETLRMAVSQIAQRNNLTPDQFRRSLAREGLDYGDFLEQVRGEIAMGRLRASQINNQIKISDREVEHYLEAQGSSGALSDREYRLGHILIATPREASPDEVKKARDRADKVVKELKAGLDFKDASIRYSDDPQALEGGDLGWRKLSEIPSDIAEVVGSMKEGEVSDPIRGPGGYHIVKMMAMRGVGEAKLTKTHVRHILIKPNEVLSDEDAKNKLMALKTRIENGDDFAELARGHSDDKGSAIKGGDLGWVKPGALVPPFEEAMNAMDENQLSDPVQTQFGWHLIQVLERQESSDTNEVLKNRAREELFKRKVDEETELWLRKIRDEAYVEIRLDETPASSGEETPGGEDSPETFMR
ncbi:MULTISPECIES: peptidylprolyl isomerase [Methylococcus]|uniref:Chaperone SurA n=1 Tax=Methylococcus capsulatus TaxID=414 RepID=A0ABZ2F6G4_METCP|nr:MULTISPECIES: peptidylprolyl isomerase [Methylococcus]MDF9392325.1 molecular chaperone SurA [Methylococcus capsulatus]